MKKLTLLLVLVLMGCSSGSSVQTKTYLLPDSASEANLTFDSISIEMPSYLQGPGLVYRLSETEIRVANQNLWAGNLKELIAERVMDYQVTHEANKGDKLNIRFERFNGSYTGNAELKGQWRLGDQSGRFDVREPLQSDGYEALVVALDRGLSQVIESIAAEKNQ